LEEKMPDFETVIVRRIRDAAEIYNHHCESADERLRQAAVLDELIHIVRHTDIRRNYRNLTKALIELKKVHGRRNSFIKPALDHVEQERKRHT
jgi:hypothetical protein